MLSSKNGPYERAVDGLSLLRRWRKKGVATPILVLTASRTDIEDTTASYAWDADYEIKRPGAEFDSLLLAWARSRSARKAVGGGSDGPKFIERGGLFINRDLREARFNGTLLDLSQTEYNVLMCLIKAGDQWSSIHDIAAGAFGAGCDNPNAQTYEYVKRLRQKLGFSAIRNQRGRGYRLCLAPAED
jgi:DNA-binding response OmpR family regulator